MAALRSLVETVRMAYEALAANRVRSALTVLSITIGAFAIVLMSSLAESGLETLNHGVEDLGGARLILVFQKPAERGEAKQFAYARGFTLTMRDRLEADIPHVVGLSMFSRLEKAEVLAESGARAMTSIVAADARFFDVFRMKVARGRPFTEEENRGRASVCVLGHVLVERIAPPPADVLGRLVTVGSLRCRVIGIFANNDRFGVGFGFDWTDLAVMPSETMAAHDPRVLDQGTIIVQTDAPSSNEIVKRMLNARLSARHPGVDDFTIFDLSGAMTSFKAVFTAMELIVALLAAITLFVGGVGVMNMMLIAVSERVREIGIRKALGARPRVIGAQFLAEAFLLSTFGGTTGVLSGLGVAAAVSTLIAHAIPKWQTSLAPWAAISALVVSSAIGIVSGWLPATKAARLAPIDAMRR